MAAINPIQIVGDVLDSLGLRQQAAWNSISDTAKDEAVRAVAEKIGEAVGNSGLTNRSMIFQIMCQLLASISAYPVAARAVTKIIDDMHQAGALPGSMDFMAQAIVGAGAGLHKVMDKPGTDQFDIGDSLMEHLPTEVQEEVRRSKSMTPEEAASFIDELTGSDESQKKSRASFETLRLLLFADNEEDASELPATRKAWMVIIQTLRVSSKALKLLPEVTGTDRQAVETLIWASRELNDRAATLSDSDFEAQIDGFRTTHATALRVYVKYIGFLGACEVMAQDVGILGQTVSLATMARDALDDFNTLEKRLRLARLAPKAEKTGLAAGKALAWLFWGLVVGIVFALGVTLYGYLGIFTDVTVEAEEGVERITAMAWAWHKYWFIFGAAGAGLTTLALMKSMPFTLRSPRKGGEWVWVATWDDEWIVKWTPLLMGAATLFVSISVYYWWPNSMEEVFGSPTAEGHTYWRASMLLGCLISLGVFVYGSALVEPIMNGLRNLLSGLFGANSYVRRFAESFIQSVANETTQTRGAVAAVLGERSIISGKITARVVMIIAVPFFSDIFYGWTEYWYIDHNLIGDADFARGLQGIATLLMIGVWGFLAIGIRTGSRPYLLPNPDIKQIGDQTLAIDRWLGKAGIISVINLFVMPMLLWGWAFGGMKLAGTSTSWETTADCERLDSSSPEFIECSTRVAALADTQAREAKLQLKRLEEMGLLDEGEAKPVAKKDKKSKAKASK